MITWRDLLKRWSVQWGLALGAVGTFVIANPEYLVALAGMLATLLTGAARFIVAPLLGFAPILVAMFLAKKPQ